MAGIRIDGIVIAKAVKDRIKMNVKELNKHNVVPCLATILVGEDQASATYVRNKHKACQEVGITTKDYKLDAMTTQAKLTDIIKELNSDVSVHGILIQLPLPKQLDEFDAISKILPSKDVDGLTPHNAGLLAMRRASLIACTPLGIMEMFDYHGIDLERKNVVLINRSNLVGKPLYHLLLEKNATVITCHSKTENLTELCQMADVVITAVGNRAKFTLTPDMINKDAVVVDVAISRYHDKLVGDSDFEQIIQKASFATPVPGGVGPMTVAMLLKNTVTAAAATIATKTASLGIKIERQS